MTNETFGQILSMLQNRPGEAYITEGGTAMYVLNSDGELLRFTGPDFLKMSDEEINQYIVNTLEQMQ